MSYKLSLTVICHVSAKIRVEFWSFSSESKVRRKIGILQIYDEKRNVETSLNVKVYFQNDINVIEKLHSFANNLQRFSITPAISFEIPHLFILRKMFCLYLCK